MGNFYPILEKEAIDYLCGLIRNITNITDSLDDLHVRTDGTFSSHKIDTLLQIILNEANEYTDQITSALVRITAEEMTEEPTLDNTVDKINTLIIYSPTGDTNYNQYLRLKNKLIDFGPAEIDMTNVYTKEQANAKFALVTDIEGIIDVIGSENMGTTATTLKGAIKEVKETVDNIEPSVEISWADYQALSEEEKNNDTLYTIPDMPTSDVNCLTHFVNYTDDDAESLDFNNLLEEGIYTFGVSTAIRNSPPGITTTYGSLKVIKYKNNKGYTFIEQLYDYLPAGFLHMYGRRYVVENDEWSDWCKISGTTVPDVAKTSITSFSTSSISGKLTYRVVNGICHVSICPMANSSIATDIEICQLPKPDIEINKALISNTDKENIGIVWMNINKSKLMGRFFIANKNGYNTFSYPVAEDWRP